MQRIILLLLVIFITQNNLIQSQQKKVTELPDISVIGTMVGKTTEDHKTFDVKEIEFSFQHYLYPGVKADIFAALHKHNGVRTFELEESFYDTPPPNNGRFRVVELLSSIVYMERVSWFIGCKTYCL